MNHAVHVERMSEFRGDHFLKWIVRALSVEIIRCQSESPKYTEHVRVDGEHLPVERVHHHASRRFRADPEEVGQISLDILVWEMV